MLDAANKENSDYLNSCKLDKAFTQREELRLKYLVYQHLAMYTNNHKYFAKDESYIPTAQFNKKLHSLFQEQSELLTDRNYKAFLIYYIYTFAKKDANNKSMTPIAEYIDKNIKNQSIREFLMNEIILNKISSSGIDDQEGAIEIFKKVVKNKETLTQFNQLCSKWEKIKFGSPSPTFSCEDINGNTVTLESLKGKYIYIDVWATWCGPCRGEIPALKELETKYGEKGICFVSISCDQNKKAWEEMVKKEELKGVQLIFGKTDTFSKDYMINGIPRFILLDREGKIINANATRPSDERTSKTFDTLLAQ